MNNNYKPGKNHVHIDYRDCLRFSSLDFDNMNSQDEAWFDLFDRKLDSCEECSRRFERFKLLSSQFPGGVAYDVREIKKETSIITAIRKSITTTNSQLENQLNKWLAGVHSLLDIIPEGSLFSHGSQRPTFATRGIERDLNGDSINNNHYIYLETSDVLWEHTFEITRHGNYTFELESDTIGRPFCLAIMDSSENLSLYSLERDEVLESLYYNESIELNIGMYHLYVLTMPTESTTSDSQSISPE